MRKLLQKIKSLNTRMSKNKRKLRGEANRIERYTHTMRFVTIGMVSGFATGFLLGRKKSLPQVIRSTGSALSLARQVKRGMRLLTLFIL